jgi:hypothetical protein
MNDWQECGVHLFGLLRMINLQSMILPEIILLRNNAKHSCIQVIDSFERKYQQLFKCATPILKMNNCQ